MAGAPCAPQEGPSVSTTPWLVAGLGNPGPEYAATRHNIGFMVADELATRSRASMARHKRAHALAAEVKVGLPGAMHRIVLVEPLSFMNESGGPVKALMNFYGVDADHLIVIHDELDLPFDAMRVKFGGGRQRPQRPAEHPQGTGHRGLPAGAGRNRATPRPAGSRGLRPQALLQRRAGRTPALPGQVR